MDSPRTSYISSPLVRQLARLADAQSLSRKENLPHLQNMPEALSRWLGWTDAISLSSALSTGTAGSAARPPILDAAEDVGRVKAGLTKAIAQACVAPGAAERPRRNPSPKLLEPAPVAPPDYATYRQRYQSIQQAMEERIEALRRRLRGQLAARSPQGTRLAAVDAVMEQVLAGREQALLHGISTQRLQVHFESLKPEGDDALGPWLDTFLKNMHTVLLAELDTRMLVVEGLLAALRSAPASR